VSKPPFICYATPAEYKQYFEKHYCRAKIITFDNIRVYFSPSKFGHVFYESTNRDGKKDAFSIHRAKRIDWIKATLENPHAELYQGWNKKDKVIEPNRRVSVVYEEFVVVIDVKFDEQDRPIKAEFITAYVADNSINSIRKSPKWDKRKCMK